MYYGWSHQNARMEMMDLPGYLDSFRQGYEQALADLQERMASMTQAYAPAYARGSGPGPRPGRGHGHRHGRHHDEDCGECRDGSEHERRENHCRDFDCDDDECACECCIGDADIVVYARCGETRVIPIELENDTRRARDGVILDVSEVRSAGGRVLPWRVGFLSDGPITLEPCSTTKLELMARIDCRDPAQGPQDERDAGQVLVAKVSGTRHKAAAAPPGASAPEASDEANQRLEDVDGCEVGYVTIRVGGCLVRPIVVAIAVVPRHCGAYHAGCSCSACC